ncbi:MAG: ion transporter [Thermoanaerobaculia bacterium]|nr:ion transporter [Thermoanaerobaculia bacterium]
MRRAISAEGALAQSEPALGPLGALRDALHAAFHESDTRIYRYVQGAVGALIVLSIALLVVEGLLPPESPWVDDVRQADRVLLTIFAIEIFLRVATFRPPTLKVFKRPAMGRLRSHLLARLVYLLRPIMLIDLLAVLALFPELRGLRALRLLRLVRTTRVFRYRNPFALLLRAFEENGLLFAMAFGVLATATLVGGISIYLIEVNANPGIETVLDGIWWALVTITTVGFGDITPITLVGKIVGGVLMVAGMFSLAMFAGIVGSSLVSGVLSIREEQFRMSDYVNHVVLCGYDESTELLLVALKRELNLTRTQVVVFDERERPRELPPEFLWVQGDPSKESELDKVRLSRAAAVIVAGRRDMLPHTADARTILITFTIRSYLKKYRKEVTLRREPLYVVVEILDSENVEHARTAGADEVIETRMIGYSMIAHAVRFHGTANAMSRVLLSGSHNVYVGTIDVDCEGGKPFGTVLSELEMRHRGGLVVGVRTATGEEIINPPRDFLVRPDMALLYLAEEPLLEPPL